jgi:hypothetical protein
MRGLCAQHPGRAAASGPSVARHAAPTFSSTLLRLLRLWFSEARAVTCSRQRPGVGAAAQRCQGLPQAARLLAPGRPRRPPARAGSRAGAAAAGAAAHLLRQHLQLLLHRLHLLLLPLPEPGLRRPVLLLSRLLGGGPAAPPAVALIRLAAAADQHARRPAQLLLRLLPGVDGGDVQGCVRRPLRGWGRRQGRPGGQQGAGDGGGGRCGGRVVLDHGHADRPQLERVPGRHRDRSRWHGNRGRRSSGGRR